MGNFSRLDYPRYTIHIGLLLIALIFCPWCCMAQQRTSSEANATNLPSFAAVSIRPTSTSQVGDTEWSPPGRGRFIASSISISTLVRLAYGINEDQIVGKPRWLETRKFNIEAVPAGHILLTKDELKPRLQQMLASRFHLSCHEETRLQSGFVLSVGKGGLHLAPPDAKYPENFREDVGPGKIVGHNWSVQFLAQMLQVQLERPVTDGTGSLQRFDIDLTFAPDLQVDSDLPTLPSTLREKTGLQLEKRKVPAKVLVIDSISEVPSDN